MKFKGVKNQLRVVHIPQVLMEGFSVNVRNEREAWLVYNTLADQHLWLFDKNVIPDFSNVIFIEMFENGEWCDYYNEHLELDWDGIVEFYHDSVLK